MAFRSHLYRLLRLLAFAGSVLARQPDPTHCMPPFLNVEPVPLAVLASHTKGESLGWNL